VEKQRKGKKKIPGGTGDLFLFFFMFAASTAAAVVTAGAAAFAFFLCPYHKYDNERDDSANYAAD